MQGTGGANRGGKLAMQSLRPPPPPDPSGPPLSSSGLHLLWGNPGGTVTLVDLVEVNRRLSEIGPGW
jgi:hypothetical protein